MRWRFWRASSADARLLTRFLLLRALLVAYPCGAVGAPHPTSCITSFHRFGRQSPSQRQKSTAVATAKPFSASCFRRHRRDYGHPNDLSKRRCRWNSCSSFPRLCLSFGATAFGGEAPLYPFRPWWKRKRRSYSRAESEKVGSELRSIAFSRRTFLSFRLIRLNGKGSSRHPWATAARASASRAAMAACSRLKSEPRSTKRKPKGR